MNKVEKTNLVKLMNQYVWEGLTKASALDQKMDDNFRKLYTKYSPEEMTISHLSKNKARHFSGKEKRVIEKMSALYLDMLVCKREIDKEIKENGKKADIGHYKEIIKMALKELLKIKKAKGW